MKRTGGIRPCSPVSGLYADIYGGAPRQRSVSGTDTSGKDLDDFRKLFSENCFAQEQANTGERDEENTKRDGDGLL